MKHSTFQPGGCRVMAFCNHLATLVISQPTASPLFPGFGIKKVKTNSRLLLKI